MKYLTFPRAMSTLLVFGACALIAACGSNNSATAAAPAATAATPATPAHVILMVPPGKTAPANLASQLSQWKRDGVLSNVTLVRKTGHKIKEGYGEGFNELAILDFPSEAGYQNWRGKANLGADVIVSQVDILLDRRSRKHNPGKSIYVISQYESLISGKEYQDYTDDYIDPNMSNQMFSGIMTRFTMYYERAASGGMSNPKAILVTEYDPAEYDRKTDVKNAYKTVLLGGTHPTWKYINDTKSKLRTDLSETYASPVTL